MLVFLVLVVAGVGAGLAGSVAGLASLCSYPALLAVGLPATAANVTNTVALTASSLGSALGSRQELTGWAPTLLRWTPVPVLGGAVGAGLLLITPPGAFERIVPILIAGASVVLLLQPRLRAAAAGAEHRAGPRVIAALFAVSVYGGYFGAAAGVLLLATLLVGMPVSLLVGNALKNVLLGAANGIAAIGFALFGPVHWASVLPLAIGVLAGSWLGPALARRVPATALRIGIAIAGLVLAAVLALDAY